MKMGFYFRCITLMTLSTIFCIACTDDSAMTEDVSGLSAISLRSSYDNYFNYEDSAQIKMTNESGIGVMKRLPWQYGIPNAGVPESWCDPNIESSDKSKKKYTEANGWELVYSNVREATAFKYIALYNRYTGLLRFFMCIFAEPGGSGSSSSMWGVYINNSTSLLNFTYKYAKGINDKAASPSFITTPVGNFSNNVFSGVGLQNGVWYGMEIECAYDPSISSSSAHTLTLMGRAVDETITVGNIVSTGTINGSIKGTMPTSSINLSFSDMFNDKSTDKSVNINNNQGVVSLGETIDKGISKNDSFFTGLWNNIKSNASKWIASGLESGAKKGLEAILTQGGSVIGDAIGGLFNSLIGGGKKEADLKVELNLNVKSDVKLTSTKITQGWSDIILPLPGSGSSSNAIYNKTLGVWNLEETPWVDVNVLTEIGESPKVKLYRYSYSMEMATIKLNPEISNLFSLENIHQELILKGGSTMPLSGPMVPYAYQDSTKYYAVSGLESTSAYPRASQLQGFIPDFLAKVSFDLIHKTTNEKYSFSRYFAVNKRYNP
ncbi:hypothetical protein E2605_07460 [Dysgonomonas capnocytophagoides]|uniref:Uncharacterized protein n=1 Tax=Dysgonomonas capnocytophagoides TaxID=45254 RepID=A0A4Y8L5Q6_9BACT|nr:hypothetical protein [Dysgonomonas capnocytophagoides]TFD97494.1 hypothetical protein E2605_07460 [Dysgonomonas capnocytophagoides]